jgi:flagellar basal-body rod modification protein FlgD
MTIPNISGSSGVGATTRNPSASLGKNEFLKMLIAQLKNQDPTNPMDGQAMAAQLAQFSSVEQLMSINEKLAQQATGDASIAQAINNSTAINAIGRDVSAIGDQIELTRDGDARVRAIVQGSGRGTLTLRDANGTVVGRRDLGAVNAGDQEFSLGGLELGLPSGVYNWSLDVTGTDGASIPVTQFTRGRVTGLEYSASGAQLVAGKLRIPIASVVSLSDR